MKEKLSKHKASTGILSTLPTSWLYINSPNLWGALFGSMVLSLPTWDTFLEWLNKLFILSVTQGVFTVKDQEIHLTSETLTQTKEMHEDFTTQKA